MAQELKQLPKFTTVRSTTGAAAADSAVVSDANYPTSSSFKPYGGAKRIAVRWYQGGGTINLEDWAEIQILIRDVTKGDWLLGEAVLLKPQQVGYLPTYGSTEVYARIARISAPSATGIVVEAAAEL